jgi:integrase
MQDALDHIAGMLTSDRCDRWTLRWSALRYQHTQAVRSKLADQYQPATANKMLSALRGVLKEAWRLGQVDAENYYRAVDLPSVRGESPLRGRALTAGELLKLAAICRDDESPAGPRDAAMLALGAAGGLRRSEIITLNVDDYDPQSGALQIRRGKGRKPRTVYATNGAADALADWLQLRGQESGSLFCPVSQTGQITYRRMIGHAFHKICSKRAKQAGVKEFTPHDLRRTFIGDLLDAGADIVTVQKLAGHANVTTTARYDRRPEAAKKKAVELLHFPYRRRVREN